MTSRTDKPAAPQERAAVQGFPNPGELRVSALVSLVFPIGTYDDEEFIWWRFEHERSARVVFVTGESMAEAWWQLTGWWIRQSRGASWKSNPLSWSYAGRVVRLAPLFFMRRWASESLR